MTSKIPYAGSLKNSISLSSIRCFICNIVMNYQILSEEVLKQFCPQPFEYQNQVASMRFFTKTQANSNWRVFVAKRIADTVEMDEFGVKAMYLFGSSAIGEAVENSDIDLLIHVENYDNKLKSLQNFLNIWDEELCKFNHLQTGYNPPLMLDIHYLTDIDIKKNINFADKINSLYSPALLLRKV